MILQIALLVIGFAILIKGADWLVDGGSALARKYNVPELAIGLTIIAFGTSMPELVVNLFAATDGQSDIVYGNIIGSNIVNLFAILGIAGLITPLVVGSSTIWKEIPISLFALVLLFFLSNSMGGLSSGLSFFDGLILLFCFVAFLYYVFRQLKNDPVAKPEISNIETKPVLTNPKIALFIASGLAFLVLGGKLVVDNATDIAVALGVSQTLIALTIVAIGTSLPELATSVVAALKKNNDIAVGNVIGSNIFNVFFILGTSAVISPIEFNSKFNIDMYFVAAGTLVLFLAMFTGKRKKLDRWEAGILLALYVGYTIYLVTNA